MSVALESLKQRVRAEGVNLGNGILKVDSFLNHQLQPDMVRFMGDAFLEAFKDVGPVDRIVTVEVSGIAPALAVGLKLNVPVVYARKKKPFTMRGTIYSDTAESRTKGGTTDIVISGEYLKEGERVLIIDDFLATGGTLSAMVRILKEAKVTLLGIGCVCEKSFQGGRKALLEQGVEAPIVTLANVKSMDPNGGDFELE